MTWEIAHFEMFSAALEHIQPNFPPGVLQGDARFSHLYFNMSDGQDEPRGKGGRALVGWRQVGVRERPRRTRLSHQRAWREECSSSGMQEFVKSTFSFTLAMSLFGIKQLENLARAAEHPDRKGPATEAIDSLTDTAVKQLGSNLRSTFRSVDNVQRGLVALGFAFLLPSGARGERIRTEYASGNDLFERRGAGPWDPERSERTRRRNVDKAGHVVYAADVLGPR